VITDITQNGEFWRVGGGVNGQVFVPAGGQV